MNTLCYDDAYNNNNENSDERKVLHQNAVTKCVH